MIYSIYHFFKHLVDNKKDFHVKKLEEFPFDRAMLSCQNRGQFPDLAICLSSESENDLFKGGELIELKSANSYRISSFNSTIPKGSKGIEDVIKDKPKIKKQMEHAGDDIFSLANREVYYLIRGKYKNNIKVVLVHGCFFETVKPEDLISQSFKKVLEDRLGKTHMQLNEKIKSDLVGIFSEQESFSKVKDVDNASVKLRFRIMSEVENTANILNKKQYPEIKDNTINLIVPYHDSGEKERILKCFQIVFGNDEVEKISLKHHLDGDFMVFQISLENNDEERITNH